MARDDVDVPPIMVKCCEAIEKYGLTSQGVYRIGGTMSKVVKLKERLDRGASCCLHGTRVIELLTYGVVCRPRFRQPRRR